MVEVTTNPPQVLLEGLWTRFDGSPKLDVLTSTVRVFHVTNAGAEIVDLAPTVMVRVGVTSTWRYVWVNPPLPSAGGYVAEYTVTDAAGISAAFSEDIIVHDPSSDHGAIIVQLTAIQTALAAVDGKAGTLLDEVLGRWFLDSANNTLTLFRVNGTILKVFDLKDDLGASNSRRVHDRVPRP